MPALGDRTLRAIKSDFDSLRCTSRLSSEARALIASVAVKRKLLAEDYLWQMGDPGEFIGIIVSGLVEITRYSSSGDEEMTMGIFGPSDVIGLSAVMKKTPYPGNAKSLVKETEVIKLYLRPLLQTKSPHITEIHTWIREMFLLHEQVLRDKIDILNAGAVENRVFELITHLIRRFGRHESHLRHYIPIRLTRAQAAKMTDVRAETIIRLISRWQKQHLLSWTQDGILIENLPMLEKNLTKNKRLK